LHRGGDGGGNRAIHLDSRRGRILRRDRVACVRVRVLTRSRERIGKSFRIGDSPLCRFLFTRGAYICLLDLFTSTRRARVDIARVFVCHAQGTRDSDDRGFRKFEKQSRKGRGKEEKQPKALAKQRAGEAACNCKQ